MNYKSVFSEVFDVAVYGSGYSAWAATRRLVADGLSVIMFNSRFDLLWESGRCFMTKEGEGTDSLWLGFLAELEKRNLRTGGQIDGPGAEAVASLLTRDEKLSPRVLLGVYPLEVKLAENAISSVVVATKGGRKEIRAKRWIDASDNGVLFQLAYPEKRGNLRPPTAYEQRVVLVHPTLGADAFSQCPLPEGATLERRQWAHEFSLCFSSKRPQTLNELAEKTISWRDGLSGDEKRAAITVISVYPYPLYGEKQSGQGLETVGNLVLASPAGSSGAVISLADRFHLGIQATTAIGEVRECNEAPTKTLTATTTGRVCDVFVSGAGTGGAVAALVADQLGSDVFVVDSVPFAGGVGSGGLINGYFHGQPGGYFEHFDAEAIKVSRDLDPDSVMRNSWHPESKKLVFERWMTDFKKSFMGEALAYEVEKEGRRVKKVLVATEQGIIEVRPKVIIDGTGDGDIAVRAGAAFGTGRPEDLFPMAYSQPCLHVSERNGKMDIGGANFDAGWVDATDPEDLTRARLEGVSHHARTRYTDISHVLVIAPVIGLRQSRHIETEEILGMDDILSHRRFENSMGQTQSPLDTHSIDFEFEDDESMFWLWGCKNFRGMAYSHLPYGVIIPKGLDNVWLACRALGVSHNAAFAVRMQRDIQRIGEAAAYAAVYSAGNGCPARDVPPVVWQEPMRKSGAMSEEVVKNSWQDNPLAQLDKGQPAGFVWSLYSNRSAYEDEVKKRLKAEDRNVSWLAAVVVAMWSEPAAEPRLIEAIENREKGVPTPPAARGARGQLIDVPNWFQAIALLRRCGTAICLPALAEVAKQPDNILNLRTTIAVTLTRLSERLGESHSAEVEHILRSLVADKPKDTWVTPSRSIYRLLLNEPQQILFHPPDADTSGDQEWRLAYAVARAAKVWGVPSPVDISPWLGDEQGLVRKAFQALAG